MGFDWTQPYIQQALAFDWRPDVSLAVWSAKDTQEVPESAVQGGIPRIFLPLRSYVTAIIDYQNLQFSSFGLLQMLHVVTYAPLSVMDWQNSITWFT